MAIENRQEQSLHANTQVPAQRAAFKETHFPATTNKLSRFTRPKLRSNTTFAHQNHWFLTTIGNRLLLPATPWIGCRCVNATRLKPFRASNLLMLRME